MAAAASTMSRPCPTSPNISEKRNGNDTIAYGAEMQQQQQQQSASEQVDKDNRLDDHNHMIQTSSDNTIQIPLSVLGPRSRS